MKCNQCGANLGVTLAQSECPCHVGKRVALGVMREPPRYAAAEYWLGDIVFLKVRDEHVRGMVTGVDIRPAGLIYAVDWADGQGSHYGIELSSEFVPEYGGHAEAEDE